MEAFEKILWLKNRCKAGLSININNHRGYYESVEESIDEDERKEIDPEVFKKMVELDLIVSIQAYPDDAVGFYSSSHYDLSLAIDEIIDAINQR